MPYAMRYVNSSLDGNGFPAGKNKVLLHVLDLGYGLSRWKAIEGGVANPDGGGYEAPVANSKIVLHFMLKTSVSPLAFTSSNLPFLAVMNSNTQTFQASMTTFFN